MKITQAKNYRKPLYALGLTAAFMAVAVSGCTPPVGYAGNMVIETRETKETEETVALAGEEMIVDETETENPSDETITPPVLEGVISIAEPTE